MVPNLLYALLGLGLVHGVLAQGTTGRVLPSGYFMGENALKIASGRALAAPQCAGCIAVDQASGGTCAQETDGLQPCCVVADPQQCVTPDDTNDGPLCCNDPPIGGVVSDPIFSSFNGGKFEFLGDAGGIYNVLSSSRHQVNMLLVETGKRHIRTQPGEGTFVQTFAFQIERMRVAVMVSEEGDMSVTLDDEDLDLDQPFSFNTSAARLQFDPHYPGKGERLEILSDMFHFSVVAVLAYEDKVSGYNRGHLDLSVLLLADPGELDGILGSTLHMPAPASGNEAEATFHDAGHENEYAVSELFGTMAPRTSLSRRRRLIELPTRELAFPLNAGLSSRA